MNHMYRKEYKGMLDSVIFKGIIDECEKRKTLQPSSIVTLIDQLFDNL